MTQKQYEEAEQKYWYSVVRTYMDNLEDWRFLDEAVNGLLAGTHNQECISDDIEYPVLRWRELEQEIKADHDA